jgi:hypothetical protein
VRGRKRWEVEDLPAAGRSRETRRLASNEKTGPAAEGGRRRQRACSREERSGRNRSLAEGRRARFGGFFFNEMVSDLKRNIF